MAIPGVGSRRPRSRFRITRPQRGLQLGQPDPSDPGAGAPGQIEDPYNFESDPALQRIIALGQRRTAEAEARALARRKQLAIEFGDESLADDEATKLAARNNPFSRRAQFEKAAREEPKALTENLNQGNLFYSSEFGKRQSDLAQNLLARQQAMQMEARGGVSDIDDELRGVREGVEETIFGAREDAADRMRERLGDLPMRRPGFQIRPGAGRPAPMIGFGRRPGPRRPKPRPGKPPLMQ